MSLSSNESKADYSLDQNFSVYKRNIIKNDLDDFKIFTYIENEKYNFILKSNEFNPEYTISINQTELADLISSNKLKNDRAELIPFEVNYLKEDYKTIKFEGGEILHSTKTNIKISNLDKTISIDQYDPNDWILFKQMNLNNWIIKLQGVAPDKDFESTQRFNVFGITGCLNFYDVNFQGTTLKVANGQCEDSLNIINSTGSINTIEIVDGYSDSVDIDFSSIFIDYLDINNAGNDCFDVSGGVYKIKKAF